MDIATESIIIVVLYIYLKYNTDTGNIMEEEQQVTLTSVDIT